MCLVLSRAIFIFCPNPTRPIRNFHIARRTAQRLLEDKADKVSELERRLADTDTECERLQQQTVDVEAQVLSLPL